MSSDRKAVPVAILLMILLCVGSGVFVASCDRYFKQNGPLQAPSLIPGAEYVGQDVCVVCHDKQAAEFRGAAHASFAVFMKGADEKVQTGEGCESCHGPGSLHVEGRGDKTKIIRADWKTCTSCHLEKKASFSKRYHHPVPEGRITCASCHDPHKGAKPVFRAEEINKTCFECHPDKRGPWTFEHDAVLHDGCTVCHEPHGSNVNKMLVADQANLCLRCHFDRKSHPGIGDFAHSSGKYLLRGCANCHRWIHGSNFDRYFLNL